jgi:HK97 family phage major capsid protein
MPVQQDSYLADEISAAMMADELSSIQQDQISGDSPVRNYNPQAFRSAAPTGNAYDAQRQAEYWRRRAEELESVEAPGQRAFKSLGVKDQADRPGAYPAAFKSYLMKGLGLMTDTEKYILQGKGKARWQNASFSYDTATKTVKTYSSGSDASVGFLVPEDWVNELNKNVMTQTVMAPECKARTTTSDRIVQPNLNTTDARRAHPAQVRWPGESPASNTDHRTVEDEYTQVTIPIHVMLITLAATNSALEDATFNLEEEINEAFAEAVAVSYDQLIWGGDGQGKLQGIVTNSQVVGSPSLGMKTVGGYVATGSADGIVTADSLKTMLFHLPQGYRQRAKWYMNSNTGLQVATLKDGNGNYLIDQRDDALRTVGVPDRLLNKPIVYNEWADDADSGKFPIILADLTRGYIIGRRVEFSIRRFDDSNYAEHDQVLFLGRARLGGQVLQPASFKALKVALS